MQRVQATSAFPLQLVLRVIELPKTTWYYHQHHRRDYPAKYAHLRQPLETIAREHPEYGYRRTTVELRARLPTPINHKVVRR